MKSISSYVMILLKSIIFLFLLVLLTTFLEYNKILDEVGTSFFLFLSLFIVLIISSYLLSKRGYLLGIVYIIAFIIISIYSNSFQYKLFLYYPIIGITSYAGYFIKKKRKTN